MRYRFYRVHKYVCYKLADFEQVLAKTDFTNTRQVTALQMALQELIELMVGHAAYEDMAIHSLLKEKAVYDFTPIEADHHQHEIEFAALQETLQAAIAAKEEDEKHLLGYELYLRYRKFQSDMIRHLNDEETQLMPKLQALYSDEALSGLQAKTYAKMTPEQMAGMLKTIFPHVNYEDKRFFLKEMQSAEPAKFEKVWTATANLIDSNEQRRLAKDLDINPSVSMRSQTSDRPQIGIGVLIYNTEGKILLGLRTKGHGQQTWAPPGGHLEFGETFENCAIREVLEETNLRIENPQYCAISNDVFKSEEKHYVSIFMKATMPKGQMVQNQEPQKVLEWQWFDVANLPSNLFLPLAQLKNTTDILDK